MSIDERQKYLYMPEQTEYANHKKISDLGILLPKDSEV
jgi:hypothetical protein